MKSLEGVVAKRDKEINETIEKLNDTISDYEQKLERKEEQIWIMGSQINECKFSIKIIMLANENAAKAKAALEDQVQQAAAAALKAPKEIPAKSINLDADLLTDLDRQWKTKEKFFMDTVAELEGKLKAADDNIARLQNQVSDLTKRQFQPRMERLKLIERDVKNRIEEYILGEERMETCLLCPRDLQIYKIPLTLVPCGVISSFLMVKHTYCKTCIESIVEENYHVIKCQICGQIAEVAYRNQQLESIAEQFIRRKTMMLSFLEWYITFINQKVKNSPRVSSFGYCRRLK